MLEHANYPEKLALVWFKKKRKSMTRQRNVDRERSVDSFIVCVPRFEKDLYLSRLILSCTFAEFV